MTKKKNTSMNMTAKICSVFRISKKASFRRLQIESSHLFLLIEVEEKSDSSQRMSNPPKKKADATPKNKTEIISEKSKEDWQWHIGPCLGDSALVCLWKYPRCSPMMFQTFRRFQR